MHLLVFITALVSGALFISPCYSSELPVDAHVDSIVVIKQKREMFLFQHHHLLKTYRIALGEQPIGAKHFKGDMCTPEGLYSINGKNPNSHYHKCLAVAYPSQADRNYAHRFGKDPGGDIKIHGLPNGQGYIGDAHTLKDWTWGCIAIIDTEIDELYSHVAIGTRINILP